MIPELKTLFTFNSKSNGLNFKKMPDKKPLFKSPYDIKDVSLLFTIVALFLIVAALLGNNLFGIFQDNVNFG